MKNEFFNPDECPYEVLGFYEVLIDAETNKVYGDRTIEAPNRPTGAEGMIEFTVTENLELTKGHKTVILKASPKRPRRVVGMIRIHCGHIKNKCDWEIRIAVADHFEFHPCGLPGKVCTSGPEWQHGHARCPKHTQE